MQVSIIYGLNKSKTGWEKTDKVCPPFTVVHSPRVDTVPSRRDKQEQDADRQTITKLVRMTIEGQVPPFLIALIFMIEFSKSFSQ